MPLSLSLGRDRVKPAGSSESSPWTRSGFPSHSFPNNGGHFLDSRWVPLCKVAKPRQHGGGPGLVTDALRPRQVLVSLLGSNLRAPPARRRAPATWFAPHRPPA